MILKIVLNIFLKLENQMGTACNFNKQRFEKEIKDFINTKYSDFIAKPNI